MRIEAMLRSISFVLPVLVLCGAAAPLVHARYIRPQLEETPIARLVENLTRQVEADPKNVTARFNLARVHAMAYALKSDTAQVFKGKEDQGAWFGYEPNHVPFVAKPTDDAEKLAAAKTHLSKAIGRYKEVLDRAPNNLSAQLGYAWCLEQAGDKLGAMTEYRKTVELGWAAEKDLKQAKLGFHSVTAEAAGYLKPLLDAERDKAELAALAEKVAVVSKIARPITPLAIPLRRGATLSEIENRDARVKFDADGSGQVKTWSWITPEAGWLVYDQRGTGRVDSALSMFGSVTFWCFWEHGYEALASLDNNGDGRLAGAELAGLAIWRDVNANGVSEPGEVKPLANWGIVSLSCGHEIDAAHPDRVKFSPHGATFANGEIRATYDLVLHSR
jgi:hypothetical protein